MGPPFSSDIGLIFGSCLFRVSCHTWTLCCMLPLCCCT
ncbi:unnamed protein product [Spirodela intermedia]|uniref:Uncharacterized protein n=1 Tax=Spirodela intermedia TaxID=51605 RepID=A0A7I8J8H0_SPIIN|nr:unnamed protein product [Spirodela intermedia]CAA6666384.1 unnamed protein product [Spirodela intermedia]